MTPDAKWSDCPQGRIVLAMGGLMLVLQGFGAAQLRELAKAQSAIRERLSAVERDVSWLREAAMTTAMVYPAPDISPR